jgi:hypothetical protein
MLGTTLTAQEQAPQRQRIIVKKEIIKTDLAPLTAEKKAERMAKELKLTEDEQKKVQEVFEKHEESRVKHQAEIEKQKEKFRLMFEAERKAHYAELENIIGKEKFEQLKAKRTEQMQKLKKHKRSMHKHQDSLRGRPMPREKMKR